MTTPLRRSARLQQSEDCNARSEIVDARRKRRRLLPSPSTSGFFGEQVRKAFVLWIAPADACAARSTLTDPRSTLRSEGSAFRPGEQWTENREHMRRWRTLWPKTQAKEDGNRGSGGFDKATAL